ncbi:hypothetical protein ACGF3G_00310 [Streptomyces sp. NPDC048179]|uniref:hypothetical protein n=1 Tax=Streptomyces sp. NPDC048179 TaxID=3365506 RepID=UPI0037172230
MANPKLSTLQDAFAASSVNLTRWNASNAGQLALDAVNDLVMVSVPTAAGSANLGSGSYDATGSSVYAQITPAPNGNLSINTAMKLDAGSSNSVVAQVYSGGTFTFKVVTAGVAVTTTLPTHDPHLHRWWMLSESAGAFTFSTSPDGLTWTALATTSYAWSATSVAFYFQVNTTGTESAGMAATIANVNTRAGGPINLNWPHIEDAWGPAWTAGDGTFPTDRFVEVSDRTRGTSSVQRGRQYETDQVRSGEGSVSLANPDAVLDPVNTAGPYAGHITPYQPYRKRAMWPPSRNLLEVAAATGSDIGYYLIGVNSDTDSTGGQVQQLSNSWMGSTTYQFGVPAGQPIGARPCYTSRPSVTPGQAYTVQARVRNVTASTTLNVKAHLGWYTVAGVAAASSYTYGSTVTLTGGAGTWTHITITGVAPATAAAMECGVSLDAVPGAAAAIQVDGWQLEKGTAASAWTCPGEWTDVYSGWTERWPSSWDLDGLYGKVEPNAVDTFALLSQQQLADALTMELNASKPRFVYKLDEPSGSTSIADWTGSQPPVQIAIGKYGAGSITFGAAVAANDSTNGTYTGSTGTVASVSNSNPGTNLTSGGASFLKLSSAGIVGPADLSMWTRMIAFRYTAATPTSLAVIWSSFSRTRANGFPSGSQMYLYLDTSGYFTLAMGGPTAGALTFRPSTTKNVADGNWHLVQISYSRANAQLTINLDGLNATWSSFDPNLEPSGLVSDNVGTWVDPTVGNGTTFNFAGNLSFVAEFPSALSTSAMTNIYQAWRNNCAGESADARYGRILKYAGYDGIDFVETSLTTSMGPANFEGQDAMSALQAVVDTENGAHYVDATGAVTFVSRKERYNALTPAYVFGEKVELGEWPYEELTLDYDSTHLSNQVTVTQESTQQQFYAVDDASVAAYFPRPLQRTINASDPNECNDAAAYLLSRYRQPATRVDKMTLHPSANPALWPVCLALDLGVRIRVMRRPPAPAPPVQIDCFVENMQWTFSDDNEAFLDLQCSPADLTPYGVFAAWHAPLTAAVSSGATAVTIANPQLTPVYSATFDTPGNWRVITGSGTDAGPITVTTDAGTSAFQATSYTVIEDLTEIPYDPTKTYQVSATVRTATAPTAGTPLVYIGLTGIAANGARVNISGANTIGSQHYVAARASQPGATYTTYTGYVSGQATPSDGGPNPDPTNPERLRPEIVRVRPLVYLLYQCTGGVQYLDSFTIYTVPAGGGPLLSQQIRAGQQLTLGNGTDNAEFAVVSAVGATSPGWTTGTLTLTAGTTKTHAAGDVVCEPVGTGDDPAQWDAVAQFDSIAFAY